MLGLLASLCNIVKRIFLCPDSLGLFQGCPKHVGHIRVCSIVDDQVKNLLVSNDIKGSHEDNKGNILLDHWDRAYNRLISTTLLWLSAKFDAELLGRSSRVFSCWPDLRDPWELARLLFVKYKHYVVSHTLLCYDNALTTINDKVAALIVPAFSMCDNLFFG